MLGRLLSIFGSYFSIGALTFGGGYAMISLMQRIVVDQHGWLTGPGFLDIIGLAGMLPGTIAINSATFIGYRVAGVAGACAAMLGVVVPSLLIVLLLASVFYRYRNLPAVLRVVSGLKMAVVAVIASAVISLGRSSILSWKDAALAGAVVALLSATKVHPILVIAGAAVAGLVLY